ncbi:MAG: hypothetical protein AB1776_01560 [Bacillota bacterium]
MPKNAELAMRVFTRRDGGVKMEAGGKKVATVPEEVVRETAAAGEPPRGLIAPEFFFLLQRIDRLDEKFTGAIKALDEKLSGEIKALDEKFTGAIKALDEKFTGAIKALDEKLSGEIKALDDKTSGEIKALDEKLSGEIKALDDKTSGEIKDVERRLSDKLESLKFWTVGLVVAVVVGFAGTIVALLARY